MTTTVELKSPKKALAVVTGVSGGIGREISRGLVNAGYAVIGQYNSNLDKAAKLASEFDDGCHFELVSADLATTAGPGKIIEVVRTFLEAHKEYDLTLLVNNAGKLLGPSLDSATPQTFDEYMAINTRAPFFIIKGLKDLFASGGGIINISSASAHLSSPGDIVYAMSKAALESLTSNLAEEFAYRGIRINNIIPGFTDNGHPGFAVPEVASYMGSFPLLGGVALPADIAAAVIFLASNGANRITGSSLDLTGGSLINARGSRGPGIGTILESVGANFIDSATGPSPDRP